jgi:predicted phage terminase large subunit-like protein
MENENNLINELWEFHKLVTRLTTGNSYIEPPLFHKEVLSNYLKEERSQLTVCPIGFAKSTTLKSYVLFRILNQNNNFKFILYASSTTKKAADHLTGLRLILKNKIFKTLFGHKIVKDNYYSLIIKLPNNEERKIEAVSDQSDILGITYENIRPMLIVVDDLEEIASATSIYQTNKKEDWLLETLTGRLPTLDTGYIRMIGTNLTRNSIINRILTDYKKIDNSQPYANWSKYKYSAIGPDGKSIWEDRHKTVSLLNYARLNPSSYASNYQNEPLDLSESLLTIDCIRTFNPTQLPEIISCSIYADLTQTKSKLSDYYSIGIIAKCIDKRYYLLDFIIKKLKYDEQIYTTINFYIKHKQKPIINFAYDAVAQDGFEIMAKKIALEEFDLSLPLRGIKAKGDKITEFNKIIPAFMSNRILFNPDIKDYDLLLKQLLYFPNDEHDDAVDMLSHSIGFYEAPTVEKAGGPIELTTEEQEQWQKIKEENARYDNM